MTRQNNELLEEIHSEREYFNNLCSIRVNYPIQDASLIPEFKNKIGLLTHLTSSKKTLYWHVIKNPELYIPKSQKNYLNKILLIQGKTGELEYRCHPDLRKSIKFKIEMEYTVDNFHSQKHTITKLINFNNVDSLYTNADYISNIIEKLKVISLYKCLEKEINGIEYFNNKEDKKGEVKAPKKEVKVYKEYHTKFTREQYEQVKSVKGTWSEPLDYLKIVDLKIDLSYDVHIALKFVIEFCEFDENLPSTVIEESIEDKTNTEVIFKSASALQIIESWIWRDNTDEIILLDLLSVLSQRYMSFLLNRLIHSEMGISYEFHFSEPWFFKYHINQFFPNKGGDITLVKRITIIIIEIDWFKMIINIKTKSNNESEYVGTFTTKEVKYFTKDLSQGLILSLT